MAPYYKIAGLTVKMNTFGRTYEQAAKYECEPCENVDFTVISKKESWRLNYPHMDEDMCEYMSTGFNFYLALRQYDGFMLHSSCVVVDNKAYLFAANSGTGKSTHTNLWLKQFGDRAYLLNDDKPALRLEDGVWYAYGTPWSGKNDISVNKRVPIAGIAILERGNTNEITRCSNMYALQSILKQSTRYKHSEAQAKLLELLDKLLAVVPVWKLKCNMDPEAAIVSYEAMSGQKFVKENDNEN